MRFLQSRFPSLKSSCGVCNTYLKMHLSVIWKEEIFSFVSVGKGLPGQASWMVVLVLEIDACFIFSGTSGRLGCFRGSGHFKGNIMCRRDCSLGNKLLIFYNEICFNCLNCYPESFGKFWCWKVASLQQLFTSLRRQCRTTKSKNLNQWRWLFSLNWLEWDFFFVRILLSWMLEVYRPSDSILCHIHLTAVSHGALWKR